MNQAKQQICREVDALAEELFSISEFLLNNPEIAYEEVKACEHLSGVLAQHGFEVEKGVGNVETAFLARPSGCKPVRPAVALLSEYDALPKIGHGCGHNLIAAAGVGAAIALRRVLQDDAGAMALVGTPAEEGGGGKVRLAEAGVFEQMDASMMFHPSSLNIAGKSKLGRIKFKIEFFGRTAHASGSPDRGINALDAMVQTYCNISMFRQRLKPAGRIHGIITHGGDAPNIIPDYAAGLFYVRATTMEYRDELLERVEDCCKGAAMATGARYEIEVYQPVLNPMRRNPALESALEANMGELGIMVDPDDGRKGSSDMGNLSHYLPSIHPYLAIVTPDIASHTVAFRDATTTDKARQALLNGAKMLAMTAWDYLNSSELREQAKKDFDEAE